MVTPTITKTPPAQRNGASLPREYDPEYLSVAYPPNEEPMADPIRLRKYMKQLQLPLEELFDDGQTLVMSNVFLYYRMGDPTKVVAPDLMVAFGVNVDPISRAKSYHTWLPGKPPAACDGGRLRQHLQSRPVREARHLRRDRRRRVLAHRPARRRALRVHPKGLAPCGWRVRRNFRWKGERATTYADTAPRLACSSAGRTAPSATSTPQPANTSKPKTRP